MKRALILVDIQNDFCPGGALEVARGDEVVPVANQLSAQFELVVATQDWHPPNHSSFASNNEGARVGELRELDGLTQIMWPDHCVQGTAGAEFHASLHVESVAKIFQKGVDQNVDSYSGFFGNGHRTDTGMGKWLRARNVTDVYILGLATDYCVKFTALDARELGFNTFLVEDGCRGVELEPGDVAAALEAMKSAGVTIVQSGDL